MSRVQPKNSAASVRERLFALSKERGEEFNFVMSRYAHIRFLRRLSNSNWSRKFVLKGATLLATMVEEPYRATADVDLLGYVSNDPAVIRDIFQKVCALQVEPDGLHFNQESVAVTETQPDADYAGVRVKLAAYLGAARIPLQFDIGFGDTVTPAPTTVTIASMLDFAPVKMKGYPLSTVVAEKLETIVRRGIANSRMQDYHDLRLIAGRFEMDGVTLCRAIRATFRARKTQLPSSTPVGLSDEFAADPSCQRRWQAFARRTGAAKAPERLDGVVSALREFVMPALAALVQGRRFGKTWSPDGGWR